VQGTVVLNAGSGSDTAQFNDQGHGGNETYSVAGGALTVGRLSDFNVAFNGMSSIALDSSSGDDAYTLNGPAYNLGLSIADGSISLENGILNANDLQLASEAVLSGYGAIDANITNAGQVNADGPAPLAIGGNYTQTAGVTNVVSGSPLSVTGLLDEQGGGVNLLDGGLEADGGYHVDYGASLTGDGQVTGNVTNAGTVDTDTSGSPLAVSGAYTQTAGVTNVVGGSALSVTGALDEQGGVLNLGNGSLQVNGGYTVEGGATLDGSGQIAVEVTNDGTIQVAGYNAIGGLTTPADSPAGLPDGLNDAGTLDMAIAGASPYDTYTDAGSATLGGTLNVQLLNNFMPTPGEWFSLLPDMTSGQFAVLNLPSLGGESFVPEYDAPNHPGFSLLVLGTTDTSLASNLNPAAPGQAVTFTASVMAYGGTPTGTMTFLDGQTVLGTATLTPGGMGAQASFTTSGLSLGSHSVTAVYGGDGSYARSTSQVWTQTVQLAYTFTSVSSSLNPSAPGQSVTFTASVMTSGNATGTVSFFDGTTPLGSATLANGTATLTTSALPAGGLSITASYNGDAGHAGSSASLTQQVNGGQSMTMTMLSSSSNYASYGQPVTFTASIMSGGSPTGTVSFYDGTTLLATVNVSNDAAAYTTSVLLRGSNSITAVYSGDADFDGNSSVLDETIQ